MLGILPPGKAGSRHRRATSPADETLNKVLATNPRATPSSLHSPHCQTRTRGSPGVRPLDRKPFAFGEKCAFFALHALFCGTPTSSPLALGTQNCIRISSAFNWRLALPFSEHNSGLGLRWVVRFAPQGNKAKSSQVFNHRRCAGQSEVVHVGCLQACSRNRRYHFVSLLWNPRARRLRSSVRLWALG
jgi:hypothetical protein